MAAWAISHHVMPFLQQVLVPCVFEVLPFPFDVRVQVGPVGFFLVYENSEEPVGFHPHLVVFQDDFFAFFYEAFFAYAFQQFPLVFYAQELLHFEFYG